MASNKFYSVQCLGKFDLNFSRYFFEKHFIYEPIPDKQNIKIW